MEANHTARMHPAWQARARRCAAGLEHGFLGGPQLEERGVASGLRQGQQRRRLVRVEKAPRQIHGARAWPCALHVDPRRNAVRHRQHRQLATVRPVEIQTRLRLRQARAAVLADGQRRPVRPRVARQQREQRRAPLCATAGEVPHVHFVVGQCLDGLACRRLGHAGMVRCALHAHKRRGHACPVSPAGTFLRKRGKGTMRALPMPCTSLAHPRSACVLAAIHARAAPCAAGGAAGRLRGVLCSSDAFVSRRNAPRPAFSGTLDAAIALGGRSAHKGSHA